MTIDARISHELKQKLPDVDESGVWERIESAALAVRRRRSGIMAAASIAAVVVVVVGWIGLTQLDKSPLPVTSDPAQGNVPAERMAMIRKAVDAINDRDTDLFIEAFSPQGGFDPRGYLNKTLFPTVPVADEDLVGVWMTIINAWGLDADLHKCEVQDGPGGFAGGPTVGCEVATRWHTLSIEITEEWIFEFSGSQLLHLAPRLVDLSPPDRTLPFGYDLIEEWEAWLESTDPAAAARFLNRRTWDPRCPGCQEYQDSLAPGDPELAARLARLSQGADIDWRVDGHSWSPDGLIPYNPALADEIEASIHEYLDAR